LRNDTRTNTGGTVTIALSMKLPGEEWKELLKVTDTGKQFASTSPITGKGEVGIRTDFMDVWFKNFHVEEL
jgi:hypothetical protein